MADATLNALLNEARAFFHEVVGNNARGGLGINRADLDCARTAPSVQHINDPLAEYDGDMVLLTDNQKEVAKNLIARFHAYCVEHHGEDYDEVGGGSDTFYFELTSDYLIVEPQ